MYSRFSDLLGVGSVVKVTGDVVLGICVERYINRVRLGKGLGLGKAEFVCTCVRSSMLKVEQGRASEGWPDLGKNSGLGIEIKKHMLNGFKSCTMTVRLG